MTADSAYGGDFSHMGRRGAAKSTKPNFNRTEENSPVRVKNFGHKAGEVLKDEETIPFKDLKQALDNTHIIFKQWKQDQASRKSNFNSSIRFTDPEVKYSFDAANFSLIDIEHAFKSYNGAPNIEKFSGRKDNFLSAEQMEAIAEKKELELRRLAAAQAEKAKQLKKAEEAGVGVNPKQGAKDELSWNITYRVEEHNVVKNMRPMVKEIVNKIREDVKQLNQLAPGTGGD